MFRINKEILEKQVEEDIRNLTCIATHINDRDNHSNLPPLALGMCERAIMTIKTLADTIIEHTVPQDEYCYYCKEKIENLSGNPGLWGIGLCHSNEPGVVKQHHVKCVSIRLKKLEEIENIIKEEK